MHKTYILLTYPICNTYSDFALRLVSMSVDYCIHELLIEQCGLCKGAPDGINEIVFTTQGGQVFHNWPDCAFLAEGQELASSRGQQNHPIKPTKWSVVFYSLGPCEWCCAKYNLRGNSLESCFGLINGTWRAAEYIRERYISPKRREHQILLTETNEICFVNEREIRFKD